jgi:hypothetical protein
VFSEVYNFKNSKWESIEPRTGLFSTASVLSRYARILMSYEQFISSTYKVMPLD